MDRAEWDQGSLGENGQLSLSEHDLFGWLGWHVRKGWGTAHWSFSMEKESTNKCKCEKLHAVFLMEILDAD